MRAMLIAVAIALTLSSVGTAIPIILPPQPEQLIEGHTVFTAVSVQKTSINESRFAAAVAVLVRNNFQTEKAVRFPGVLWFNDQYLLSPSYSRSGNANWRYPCNGAVLAVNAGDPDPRAYNYTQENYVESYHLTDPHNHVWDVDKWNFSGYLVWTVAMRGVGNPSLPDFGERNCGPYGDSYSFFSTGPAYKDPGDHGYRYPCGGVDASACPDIQYNALLFMWVQDLTIAGQVKNHTRGSTDWNSDVAGCSDPAWPCPKTAGVRDDNREGNSHPYNPGTPAIQLGEGGADNHGSDACGVGYPCHVTRQIDIYYGPAGRPLVRSYAVFDTEGDTAPYHCEGQAPCSPGVV